MKKLLVQSHCVPTVVIPHLDDVSFEIIKKSRVNDDDRSLNSFILLFFQNIINNHTNVSSSSPKICKEALYCARYIIAKLNGIDNSLPIVTILNECFMLYKYTEVVTFIRNDYHIPFTDLEQSSMVISKQKLITLLCEKLLQY